MNSREKERERKGRGELGAAEIRELIEAKLPRFWRIPLLPSATVAEQIWALEYDLETLAQAADRAGL